MRARLSRSHDTLVARHRRASSDKRHGRHSGHRSERRHCGARPHGASATNIGRSRRRCRRPAIRSTWRAGCCRSIRFRIALRRRSRCHRAAAATTDAALARLKAAFPRRDAVGRQRPCRSRRPPRTGSPAGSVISSSAAKRRRMTTLVRRLAAEPRVILSLDFRDRTFDGPPALLADAGRLAAPRDRHDADAGRKRRRAGPRTAARDPRCRAATAGSTRPAACAMLPICARSRRRHRGRARRLVPA